MTYRKEEYEANGHDVTIQQTRGPDSDMGASDIAAWIDGWAVYVDDAVSTFLENSESPDNMQDKVAYLMDNGDEWEAIKTVIAYMTECGIYFCPKCHRFYDYRDVISTGFAGHKCSWCAKDDDHCPDNPDGDTHEDECLNPSQKHNARRATKYRCVHCGRSRKTVPTG